MNETSLSEIPGIKPHPFAANVGSYEEDRYVEDHIQYDLSVKYRLTPEFQLFAELVNLGDEPYVAYQPGPGRKRLLQQYEEYSWTGKMGFRVNF